MLLHCRGDGHSKELNTSREIKQETKQQTNSTEAFRWIHWKISKTFELFCALAIIAFAI
jgi:hypothetical protein